jgi:sirohydrochlorin cobaltochelatase
MTGTPASKPGSGIVLLAHGARDPEWAGPLRAIASHIREGSPGLRVELAFLEFMAPALGDAVDAMTADGCDRITLVPLFLAQGGHLKKDLPVLLADIRARHPGVDIRVTPAIGDAPELVFAIGQWALRRHRDA